MSQVSSKQADTEKGKTDQDVTDDHPELPHLSQNQPSSSPPKGESNFGDSSGPIFSMYSKITKEDDDQVAERWQKDADGVLIFTGLFSAAVAALLAVSVQDLRPSSQDTSAFYLGNIYQVLADPSAASVPSPVAQLPPFSPPIRAVWVNSLWSLSLVISLVSALLATSLQQWARQYIRAAQPKQCSPEKHARRRAFFAGGVDRMRFRWAVEALPLLIHVSLFLFFSGLIIFMQNINHSVYLSIILAVGLFSAVYVFFTFMPIFWPDSPYKTPLSLIAHEITRFVTFSLVWCFIIALYIVGFALIILEVVILTGLIALLPFLFTVALFIRLVCGAAVFRSLSEFATTLPSVDQMVQANKRFVDRASSYIVRPLLSFMNWVPGYSRNATGKHISEKISKIDLDILQWTIGALGDDDTLQKFFEGIPGFFHSHSVRELKRPLPDTFVSRFSSSWGGFLARNLLSNSVGDEVKTHRTDICMKAIKEICAYNGGPSEIFCHLYHLRFDQAPPSIHTAEILGPLCASHDSDTSELARYTVAKMLPYIRERNDDRWVALARDVFGLQENTLRNHIARGGDSVLLFILIRATREVISTGLWKWDMLTSISKFDILNTLPELRNDFCSLWNEIVQGAKDGVNYRYFFILHEIRHLYIALHQGTDSAPSSFDSSTPDDDDILFKSNSYPSCAISAHRPASTVLPLPRLEDPHHPSPLISLPETQPTSGGCAVPHQAKDSNVITGCPLSGNPSSSLLPSQESPFPDPNTVPEHIAPQANTAVSSSIHESTQTATLDVNQLAVAEMSHFSHQSSLPTAALTANVVHARHPTTDAPINEMGQASQTPTVTVHKLPLSDAIPVIVTPLAIPSASDGGNEQKGIATSQSVSTITKILSTGNQIPQLVPNIGATLQTGGQPTSSPTLDPDSLSSPTITPIFHSGTIHEEFHSSVGSTLVQRDNIHQPLGSPSSSLATARSDISPQITSVVDAHASMSSGLSSPSMKSKVRDMPHSISMEVSGRKTPSVPSDPNIVEHTSTSHDHQDD